MKRKSTTRVAAAVLSAALAAGFAISSATAEEAILGHIFDREHIFHKVSERFMEQLGELSGGTITIRYHPGGDLGDWEAIVEQVAQGAAQMTMAWNHSELDPRWDIAALGFVADDWSSAKAVYGPGSALEGIYDSIVEGLGMDLLGIIPTDFAGFVVRSGVQAPTSFPKGAAGFKMRVPGWPMAINRYQALGFSAVPMPFSEVHTALQTGAIDGRAYSPPSEVPMFGDVLSSYVFTREHFEHTFWLANRAWLQSLTEEQQGWIRTAATEASDWSWSQAEADSNEWLEKIRAAGVEVIELPEEERANYRQIVIGVEYPYIEELVGAEIMEQIKQAAGN